MNRSELRWIHGWMNEQMDSPTKESIVEWMTPEPGAEVGTSNVNWYHTRRISRMAVDCCCNQARCEVGAYLTYHCTAGWLKATFLWKMLCRRQGEWPKRKNVAFFSVFWLWGFLRQHSHRFPRELPLSCLCMEEVPHKSVSYSVQEFLILPNGTNFFHQDSTSKFSRFAKVPLCWFAFYRWYWVPFRCWCFAVSPSVGIALAGDSHRSRGHRWIGRPRMPTAKITLIRFCPQSVFLSPKARQLHNSFSLRHTENSDLVLFCLSGGMLFMHMHDQKLFCKIVDSSDNVYPGFWPKKKVAWGTRYDVWAVALRSRLCTHPQKQETNLSPASHPYRRNTLYKNGCEPEEWAPRKWCSSFTLYKVTSEPKHGEGETETNVQWSIGVPICWNAQGSPHLAT